MFDVKVSWNQQDHILRFPERITEISSRQWSDWQIARSEQPEWFQDFDSITDPKQIRLHSAKWTKAQTAEYIVICATMIERLTGYPWEQLGQLKMSQNYRITKQRGLMEIYQNIRQLIIGYQPKPIESFEHRGRKFLLPESGWDMFSSSVQPMADIKVFEAVQSLNFDMMYSDMIKGTQEQPEDDPFDPDFVRDETNPHEYKHQNDLGLVASLAREVVRGQVEMPPRDIPEWSKRVQDRIDFFSDMTADKVLDIRFFLTSSGVISVNTQLSALRSKVLPQLRNSVRKSVNSPESNGEPGAG